MLKDEKDLGKTRWIIELGTKLLLLRLLEDLQILFCPMGLYSKLYNVYCVMLILILKRFFDILHNDIYIIEMIASMDVVHKLQYEYIR